MTKKNHEIYMQKAMRQAMIAFDAGEIPVGCVIVQYPEDPKALPRVIGQAYNQVELLKDPTAHAEIIAITQAANALENWRLTNTVMYVTKEPCSMCAGAIVLARIDTVVWGLSDPKRGGNTVFNILDNDSLNHRTKIVTGVCEDGCKGIIQEFFAIRRKENKEK
ncbi:MAG: nucleoside deaminase [Kiritimatiellae bacterium]|jgi:tRNA(adenine34) deaminase|nr:nucleoside deaminase [Kiritimatiellia bacterium]